MHIVIVTEGGEHPLEVDPIETTAELKQRLEGLLGIPARRQILSCDPPDFFDFMTMEFLDVKENDRIVLTINSEENRFRVALKVTTVMMFFFDVEEMDTVSSLKKQFLEIAGGQKGEQAALFYQGTEMRDNRRLCEYKLTNECEITAAFTLPKRLSFLVENPLKSTSISVEMNPKSTVNDLKKLLGGENYQVQEGDYVFIFKDVVLEGDDTLFQCGVRDGDSIRIYQN